MTCRELAEFILEYTTGDLPRETREVFELHLSRCGNCHEYLEQYKHTIDCERKAFASAEELLPAEVPEELIQAILRARREMMK